MKIERFTQLQNTDKLAKIIFMNFMELQNQPDIEFSYESIKEILMSPSLVGWFLMDDTNKIIGYLIGTITGLTDGRQVYFIHYFYIIQKYRRFGLATKMLLIAINHISNINIKFVMLISKINSEGWGLYIKYGFLQDSIIKLNNNDYKTLVFYCEN
jgi:ribosomal protein S18 acetylase RimI-like enzyme